MFENIALLEGLKEHEKNALFSLGRVEEFKGGQTLINEGSTGRELFIILEGEVEILKLDHEQSHQHPIGKLSHGEFFGDMSFIENTRRSTTVRTLTPCKLFILDYSHVKETPFLSPLSMAILKIANKRQKTTNEDYAQKLEEEVGHLQKRNQFGRFFIYMFIAFGAGTAIEAFAREHHISESTISFSWTYLLLLFIPIFLIALGCKLKLKEMGLTYHNWLRSTLEGIGFAAVLGTCFYLSVYFLNSDYHFANKHSQFSPLFIGTYTISSFIQELMARGIIQTTLLRFYGDAQAWKAVLTTSLIFGMVHLHISFIFALITFVGSVLFGFIFLRHKNLFGVTIVHATLGLESVYLNLM